MSLKDIALDILFIGHSLVGPTMPGMLENAVSAMGGTGQVEAQIINGAPLGYNWEHGAGAEGVNARDVLPSGEFEVLVLTEGLPLAPVSDFWRTADVAYDYYQIATASNPSTQVFIYETWHSILSGTGASLDDDPGQNIPWRTRIDEDLKLWQGFVSDVNARLDADAPPVQLIPAGQAMGLLADRIQAGQVPAFPISPTFSRMIFIQTGSEIILSPWSCTRRYMARIPPPFLQGWGANPPHRPKWRMHYKPLHGMRCVKHPEQG